MILERNCELLTPFGTATRYPGGAMTIGPDHKDSVLAWAESVRSATGIPGRHPITAQFGYIPATSRR